MGIFGDIGNLVGTIGAAKGAKKRNKELKAQYKEQQGYADQQKTVAATLGDYIKSLAGTSADTYRTALTPAEQAVQNASYGEELDRNTSDQAIRRTGLLDAERMRRQASGESDTALRDLDNFRAGVGRIDPVTLANTMRLNRTGAINAGYDDAANAAKAISLRTGSSAGDALTTIARNRTKDIASLIGDPETEALTTADTLNTNRYNTLAGSYDLFNKKGSNFYDASFSPSSYNQQNIENAQKDQALDLTKYDTLFGGSTNQGALLGSAARGLREAANAKVANTNYNVFGQLASGVGKSTDALSMDLAKMFAGG